MTKVHSSVIESRIIAVVRLKQYDKAISVAQALVDGGISAIEWTLTGEGACDAIAETRAALGDAATIGVGTVLHADAAEQAIAAGAQFVVTPAVRPAVIAACRARNVPAVCGALTPTEVLAAHEAGADTIKIFPAHVYGPQYIRDLLAPFPGLQLVPTGGINADNARAYLDAGAVAIGIGGNLVTAGAVEDRDWAAITAAARRCVDAIRG